MMTGCLQNGCHLYNKNILTDILNQTNYEIVKKNGITYINKSSSLDIETTNITKFDDKGKLVLSFGTMYIWQFAVNNSVVYGRDWESFLDLIAVLCSYYKLRTNRRFIIYVHNLSYEFQFIRKHFEWYHVFARKPREPISAVTISGIEFRCSYTLTGLSLERLAEKVPGLEKKVGDLDYSLIRNSITPLTEKEFGYIENDVRIIERYINQEIKNMGDISKIPLTKTGYVRLAVGDRCRDYGISFRRKIFSLRVNGPSEYAMLKFAFQGGFTHANANYTGKIVENCRSMDITSSYPTVMIANKFPMSCAKRVFITGINYYEYLSKYYCMIFLCKLYNLRIKVDMDCPISSYKAVGGKKNIVNCEEDNGRVFSADEITLCITNVDFEIYKMYYEWDDVEFGICLCYEKDYLPKPIVESVLEFYKNKTTLKGVEGKEDLYLRSKEYINSVYGMCVTDIVMNEVEYDDAWKVKKGNVEEWLEKYNKNRNRFLYYPWGVFVTAYARYNLLVTLYRLKDNYIYSDTDSLKFKIFPGCDEIFNQYNRFISNKLIKAVGYHNLDESLLSPVDKNGKHHPLGVWENDGDYLKFKTLGAKRYFCQSSDGKYHLTVAGLSKKKACAYISGQENPFEFFADEMCIPSKYSGRLIHSYSDDAFEMEITDCFGNTTIQREKSYITLYPSDYNLSMPDVYKKFLDKLVNL